MSRSYRFRKEFGRHSVTVSGFNKGIHDDKKENNRRLRRKSENLLRGTSDYENLVLPYRLEEVMERWSYRDDGKTKFWTRLVSEYDNPWRYLFK